MKLSDDESSSSRRIIIRSMPAIGVPLACDLACDLACELADPNDPDKVDGDQDDDPDRNNKVS